MTPLHQAALDYAARGVPVFPVEVGGKRPACAHGHKDATTDATTINNWWYAVPTYNIATVPAMSGLVVIDIDDKHGHQGSASWAALCPEGVDTLMVRTPSGGLHIYFQGNARPSAGKLGDGLDVRGEDSYVLLPPSIIADVRYAVINPAKPAPLPAHIATLLDKPRHEPAAAPEGVEADPVGSEDWAVQLIEATIAHDGPAVVGASLNERTYALACRLKDGPQYGYSISEDRAVYLLLHWWAHADRIEETARNAYRSGENAPGCGQAGSASRAYDPILGVRPYDPEPTLVGERPVETPIDPTITARTGLISGSSMTMEAVRWIWPGWLAHGKFHVLGGQKGTGKSTLTFSLLAQVTIAGKWPDGLPAPLGDVLIWSGEDDIQDTILPRLVGAGGDRSRVWFPDRVSLSDGTRRHFDPAVDMASLLEECRALPSLKVIVVDPIVSASTGDSHKNAETRRGLQPLVDFASETGAAVIGITHFTKGTQGRDPIERITGSLAFGALPRIVWGASKGEEEDAPRRLVRIASNIGQSGGGFEYLLQQAPVAGQSFTAQRIAWGKHIEGGAKELIDGSEEGAGKGLKAAALLDSLLREAGTAGVFVKDIKAAAEAHGVSWPTVERAKQKMGSVEAFKNLGSGQAPWSWRLVPKDEG